MVGNLTSKTADNAINLHPRIQKDSIEVLWSPPIGDWIKCNIDGVAAGSPLLTASSGIFCDSQANHIISFSVSNGAGSPAMAGFLAAIIAIEKSMQMKWTKLWLESDCVLVVKAFSNPNLVPWNIKSCWLTCWAFSMSIDFRITHLYCEANFCANNLANIGLKSKSSSWFNFVHSDVNLNYLLDKAGTPRLRLVL
ncbi:uncharacterized protein LOC131605843 [Vicia villosa]|uniref:uncharacterized protein LOC131605843 n=1 Tax=Vicia villosa TaxID=3911 RepID=UPI00273B169D|nr:uncharacterized protein LOC131605843 [Vicia villosa]